MDNNTNSNFKSLPLYQAGILIWKTVPPILILFGTCGSVLSIAVLTGKSIRRSTTGLYLIVLTFSDLAVLYTGLLRQWIIYLFDFDVRQMSGIACKLHTWLVYSSLDFSAWLLIAITLERIIAVWYPYVLKVKCNRQNGSILVAGILISVLVLNSHFLYGMVIVKINHEKEKCGFININYEQFIHIAWSWIDLCAFCLIPLLFIMVGNCLILLKIAKQHRKTKRSQTFSKYDRRLKSKDKQQSSMTTILITLNTVFLLTTLPISIYNIGHSHWSSTDNEKVLARLDVWLAVVNMLMYTNNSVNFVLYTLSGSQFRLEAKRIFCHTSYLEEVKSRNILPSQDPAINNVVTSDASGSNSDIEQQSAHENHNCLVVTGLLRRNTFLSDNRPSNAFKHDSFLSEDELAESQVREDSETVAPIAAINEANRVSYVE